MSKADLPGTWTVVPERRFQDHVAKSATWAAEHVREAFLRIGLPALRSSEAASMHFPPVKANSRIGSAGRKDLHRNRFVEIGIVTKGEMTIWWEGVTTRCSEGSIFVIPPGIRYMPHVRAGDQPSPIHSVIWLAVHKSYAVVHMCTLDGNRHLLSEYYSFTNSQLMAQAQVIAQEMAVRAPHFETAVRGSVMCLLTWLLRAPAQPLSQFVPEENPEASEPEPIDVDQFIERVRNHLRSHYHRPLTLTQVARAVGCSPAYLCRRFRESTGETPFHFLRDIRIEAAKRLLQSDVTVGRVAEMVGFDDPLYFSKVFAKQTGESPKAFRSRATEPVAAEAD